MLECKGKFVLGGGDVFIISFIFYKYILTMDSDKKVIEDFLNDSLNFNKIKKGSILQGEIISSLKDEVIVNINYFCDGIVKKDELLNEIIHGETYLKGEKINVYVISLDDGFGNVLLSEKRADYEKSIEELEEFYKNGDKINVVVKEELSAGLICYYKGVRGFIPKSRISVNKVLLSDYLNKVLEVILIEFDINKNRIVFSGKEIEEEKIQKHKRRVLNEINIGDKFLGTVKSIKDFGIFVDINGVQGLVHKSEITYKKNFNISDFVSVGDKIDVYVLNFDKENGKLSLTMKDLNYNPFQEYKNHFIEGNVYEVVILKIISSGVIVSLNDELSGFIHLSEFPDDINNLNKSFKIGDKIKAKVLNVDEESKKISLSYSKVFEEDNDLTYTDGENLSTTLGDIFGNIFSKLK